MDIIACTPLKVKGQKEKALFIINKAPQDKLNALSTQRKTLLVRISPIYR